MTLVDLPHDLISAARCRVAPEIDEAYGSNMLDSPAARNRFRCIGIFKLGQTCRALHEATALERRALADAPARVHTEPDVCSCSAE